MAEDWLEDDVDAALGGAVDENDNVEDLFNELAGDPRFESGDPDDLYSDALEYNLQQGNLQVEEKAHLEFNTNTSTTIGDIDELDIYDLAAPANRELKFKAGKNAERNQNLQRNRDQDDAIEKNREDIDTNRRWILKGIAGVGLLGLYSLSEKASEMVGHEDEWDHDIYGLLDGTKRRSSGNGGGKTTPTPGKTTKGRETVSTIGLTLEGDKTIKAVPDEEFGGYTEILDHYDSKSVEAMFEEQVPNNGYIQEVAIGEDDRVYLNTVNTDGWYQSASIDGIYEDAQDGNLGDEK